MTNEISELFKLAAKFFFKKYKEQVGSQGDLAREFGVTQAYLSSVMNGSRSASFDLYNQIAERLYGPLDKFLAVGRSIREGRDPLAEEKNKSDDNSVESLIARLTYYVMDHQRMTKEVKELKHFYETIVENLQSAVVVLNKDNKIVFANRQLERISGITPEKVNGVSPFNAEQLIPGLEISSFVKKYSQALERMEPLYFENIAVRTPRGNFNYNSGWLIPMVKAGVFDGMICTIRDTSNSHALFSLLTHTIEHLPDAVVVVQQHAAGEMPVAFFANRLFRKILGLDDVDPFTLPFSEMIELMKKNVRNGGKWEEFIMHTIKNNTVNARVILDHINGKNYEVIGNPIADENGLHIGRIATVIEKKKRPLKNR